MQKPCLQKWLTGTKNIESILLTFALGTWITSVCYWDGNCVPVHVWCVVPNAQSFPRHYAHVHFFKNKFPRGSWQGHFRAISSRFVEVTCVLPRCHQKTFCTPLFNWHMFWFINVIMFWTTWCSTVYLSSMFIVRHACSSKRIFSRLPFQRCYFMCYKLQGSVYHYRGLFNPTHPCERRTMRHPFQFPTFMFSITSSYFPKHEIQQGQSTFLREPILVSINGFSNT